MRCEYCEKDAVYKCSACGRMLCAEHVKQGTVCLHVGKAKLAYTVHKVRAEEEKSTIRKLVRRFWGEQEQLTFDRRFVVAELPAYVAKVTKNRIIGFVSMTETSDAVIVVALGVLPQYQGFGVGRRLIEKVESEAKRLRKRKVLVSTSNDDLPALAFYQALGFQVFEVKPNVIAEKHGTVLQGIGGLPIRDELRLQIALG